MPKPSAGTRSRGPTTANNTFLVHQPRLVEGDQAVRVGVVADAAGRLELDHRHAAARLVVDHLDREVAARLRRRWGRAADSGQEPHQDEDRGRGGDARHDSGILRVRGTRPHQSSPSRSGLKNNPSLFNPNGATDGLMSDSHSTLTTTAVMSSAWRSRQNMRASQMSCSMITLGSS